MANCSLASTIWESSKKAMPSMAWRANDRNRCSLSRMTCSYTIRSLMSRTWSMMCPSPTGTAFHSAENMEPVRRTAWHLILAASPLSTRSTLESNSPTSSPSNNHIPPFLSQTFSTPACLEVQSNVRLVWVFQATGFPSLTKIMASGQASKIWSCAFVINQLLLFPALTPLSTREPSNLTRVPYL